MTKFFAFFFKVEVSAKNVHSPFLYQVFLLLKRKDVQIGKKNFSLSYEIEMLFFYTY